MGNKLLGWLTINQMLFLSHLVLVLSIVFGMSYNRFSSEWQSEVEHTADLTKSYFSSQMTFLSGSVAGRNYANLLMRSTADNFKAIQDLIFVEISGVSDYTSHPVSVQYLRQLDQIWRTDVTDGEIDTAKGQLQTLKTAYERTPKSDTVRLDKLKYLLNKSSVEIELLEKSVELTRSTLLPSMPDNIGKRGYFLDPSNNHLHVVLPLRNKNAGYLWAVVDAKRLSEIKLALLGVILKEAVGAFVISLVLIYLITIWLVSPLKALAFSMKQDIEKIDQGNIPEIRRADEIGDLARSYSSLITKIKNQLKVLHLQAETDPLTGLGSRYKYKASSAKTLQNTLLKREHAYFLLCDIDNFKSFNDTYGHTEGDNVLTDVASVINQHIRRSEIACRIGGEEFAFIITGRDPASLTERVQHIHQSVAQRAIRHEGNLPFGVVTISIGAVAIESTSDKISLEQCEALLKQAFEIADKQLYKAKHSGRNRVLFGEKLSL
ncbi:diguanylate cyclase [Vibrio navarrensis]